MALIAGNNEAFDGTCPRLGWKTWLAVAAIVAAVLAVTPWAWRKGEKAAFPADYRQPYALSSDYWSFQRWCRDAAATRDVLVLGDSAVWGEYVGPDETLSAWMTRLDGTRRFANLGVDGVHPAAQWGLVSDFAQSVAGKDVILYVNLLWMSTPAADLRGAPVRATVEIGWLGEVGLPYHVQSEVRFNHPTLVPQFHPWIGCYKASLADRMTAEQERAIGFYSLLRHAKVSGLDNLGPQEWALLHPYGNPVAALSAGPPAARDQAPMNPVPWAQTGAGGRDLPWMKLEDSFQWRCLREVIGILRSRGNRLLVVVGPFNTHMLTAGSAARYAALRGQAAEWLAANRIPCIVPDTLPSDEYGDGSHPLSAGYRTLAQAVLRYEFFR